MFNNRNVAITLQHFYVCVNHVMTLLASSIYNASI